MTKLSGMAWVVLFALVASLARAEDKPAAPAPAAKRTTEQIMADITVSGQDLQAVMSSPEVLTDAAKRTAAAPKALPALQKLDKLSGELAAGDDERGKTLGKQIHNQIIPMLALFGDEKTVAALEKQAAGTDEEALAAKTGLLVSRWFKSSTDAAAQGKIVEEATALAKANPESRDVAQALMAMSQVGAAKPELSDKVQAVVLDNMKGPLVEQIRASVEGDKKLKAVEGTPLAIAGKTMDGADFTTANWKGKVILVDFWATWCGPCVAELPRVKKAYADFHAKGLEVLGVSNDQEAAALKKFVSADASMPWPQLFDTKAAAAGDWNPITKGFGINGIPTMFLIDKKGVCRTVSVRENFEELIPKMLAE